MDPRLLCQPKANVPRYPIANDRQMDKLRAIASNPKRHGTYIPCGESFQEKLKLFALHEDNESTWEFSAPLPSRSSSSSTIDSNESTPAQDIVIRYRAGLPLDFLEDSSCTQADSESEASWETIVDDDEESDNYSLVYQEPIGKIISSPSRQEALNDSRVEALRIITSQRRNQNDNIVCERPGCRDTLRGLKALMCHLHIHNIHDRSPNCPKCRRLFDTKRELEHHRCAPSLWSPPPSPLKDGFSRVVCFLSRQL